MTSAMDIDITSKIERLEAFEERLGVRLKALFASSDDTGIIYVKCSPLSRQS